jgi:hypothetical protein
MRARCFALGRGRREVAADRAVIVQRAALDRLDRAGSCPFRGPEENDVDDTAVDEAAHQLPWIRTVGPHTSRMADDPCGRPECERNELRLGTLAIEGNHYGSECEQKRDSRLVGSGELDSAEGVHQVGELIDRRQD